MKFDNKTSNIVIIILLIILGYLISIITDNITSNLDKNIKCVTKNTKVIDANIDHNQALDVYEYANKQGVKSPDILVNFDTHSDIYLNKKVINKNGARIEDWINEYIAKNPNVHTVYWVMPKEAALDKTMQKTFRTQIDTEIIDGFPLIGVSFKPASIAETLIPLTIKAFERDYLINPTSGVLNEYYEENELNDLLFDKNIKYKKVKIITCTENSLPDFKGADVFVSIDADYLSNSGYDTFEDFENNKDKKGIYKAYKSMFKTIRTKNMNPTIISMTISPQYLPKDDHNQVIDLFEKVFIIKKQKDVINSYTRHFTGDGKKSKLNDYKTKEDVQ